MPELGGGGGEFLMKMELPTNPMLLCVARGAVEALARLVGFSDDESYTINLALGEAMTNIIRHAYEGRNDRTFQLVCLRLPDGLEFLLLDQGRGADPTKFQSKPLGELREGGFGTHIIAQVMDEVRYERREGTNWLRLVKLRSGKDPGAS